MALIECKDCKNFVSSDAQICPKCGCPIEKSLEKTIEKKLEIEKSLAKPLEIKNNIPKKDVNNDDTLTGCFIFFIVIIVIIIIVANCDGESDSEVNDAIINSKDLDKRYFEELKEDSIKRKIDDSIFKAEEEIFLNSKAGRIYKKHPEWTRDDCERLANKSIWIGMTYEMIVYLRGKPNKINTSNYGDGNDYQAVWNDYNPSYFYFKDDHIIYSYN
jgi:RNA polymerase subunit RPABC4/transcription elongation factor Spt4